jgi:FxsC-like protein
MPFTCFVSYVRTDRQDAYIKQFVDDLRTGINVHTTVSREDAVFFDTESLPLASEWEPKLRQALSSAKVMVSLCSPNYLDSDFCGREYKVFLERRERSIAEQPRTDCDVIIPLLWVPPDEPLPKVISQFQYSHPALPNVYKQDGLYLMMKLTKYSDDYQVFLNELVKKIVSASHVSLSNFNDLGPFTSIENAFKPGAASVQQRHRGPNNIYFAYIAAAKNEIAEVRQTVTSYGNSGWDWSPYGTKIGKVAQGVTTENDFRYRELELDKDLIVHIEEAERNKEIVVLLVDAWTVGIQGYGNILRGYDGRYFINSGALVAWGTADPETDSRRERLLQGLQAVFPRKMLQPPVAHCWEGISSEEGLRRSLESVLNVIQMNVLSVGKVERKAESTSLVEQAKQAGITLDEKPTLRGPSATSI